MCEGVSREDRSVGGKTKWGRLALNVGTVLSARSTDRTTKAEDRQIRSTAKSWNTLLLPFLDFRPTSSQAFGPWELHQQPLLLRLRLRVTSSIFLFLRPIDLDRAMVPDSMALR